MTPKNKIKEFLIPGLQEAIDKMELLIKKTKEANKEVEKLLLN